MSTPRAPHLAEAPLVTSRRGQFWIPGEVVSSPFGTVQRGPMYVSWEAPEVITQPHPVVLVHGGGGQGSEWLSTVDGKPGMAAHLVSAGFATYVVDRPGHGRSPYHPDVIGPMGAKSMSESPYNPVAAAMGNAIANATNIRFTATPFKPDRLFPALKEKFG